MGAMIARSTPPSLMRRLTKRPSSSWAGVRCRSTHARGRAWRSTKMSRSAAMREIIGARRCRDRVVQRSVQSRSDGLRPAQPARRPQAVHDRSAARSRREGRSTAVPASAERGRDRALFELRLNGGRWALDSYVRPATPAHLARSATSRSGGAGTGVDTYAGGALNNLGDGVLQGRGRWRPAAWGRSHVDSASGRISCRGSRAVLTGAGTRRVEAIAITPGSDQFMPFGRRGSRDAAPTRDPKG